MNLDEPKGPGGLYVLTGPTAVGKTALALEWAQAYGAEIVSCDALLFYRGADIGTAKPSRQDQACVPHHGLDLVGPEGGFDVGRYVQWARSCVEAIWARGNRVLVTGGSGFYLKSFFQAMVDPIAVPQAVRREVELYGQEKGLEGWVQALRDCNPGVPVEDYVALKNPRRVQAALARCWASGQTLAQLRKRLEAQPEPFADCVKKLWILEREDGDLKVRIEQRVYAMLAQGLVGEVRTLMGQGMLRNPTLMRAIGYREPLAFLHNELPEQALAQEIIKNTWRLVKKQRTWMRTQLKPNRVFASGGWGHGPQTPG